MKHEDKHQSDSTIGKETSEKEHRPKKGLEDWEMLQQREEPPLKIPYWFVILVGGLILVAVFLSFPLMGERAGYERPWLDWGLLVGVGYGVVALIAIYFIMRKKKKESKENENLEEKSQKH